MKLFDKEDRERGRCQGEGKGEEERAEPESRQTCGCQQEGGI